MSVSESLFVITIMRKTNNHFIHPMTLESTERIKYSTKNLTGNKHCRKNIVNKKASAVYLI